MLKGSERKQKMQEEVKLGRIREAIIYVLDWSWDYRPEIAGCFRMWLNRSNTIYGRAISCVIYLSFYDKGYNRQR